MKRFSVIICTYNREKYIYNALKSIADQDFPKENYEIVVVNNNSTDNTELICKQFQLDYPDVFFHYVMETTQGLSFARNRGIDESKGEIIIYLDDDATAVLGYLQEYDNFFRNYPDAIAAGGPIYPYFETREPAWMSVIMKQLIGGYLYFGEKIKPFKNGKYPGGGNAAYYKTAFEQFGYFNTDLGRSGTGLMGSEEKDMFNRFRNAKKPFYYLPKAAILHYISELKLSKEYFRRLCYSIGVGEKRRTQAVSKQKYNNRLCLELIKWMASFVIFGRYLIAFSPCKGIKFLQFRWYVTKGLLSH